MCPLASAGTLPGDTAELFSNEDFAVHPINFHDLGDRQALVGMGGTFPDSAYRTKSFQKTSRPLPLIG